ncbi:uncharacterized protein LOC129629930 isoform X2 [Bubalus kerabau]|uniref:uncharacterized protein LOC129629930 isoform X2 n=1 Tax=Bubalus carabanensis TaxID=3119969 RepID=UPI00244E9635|nr:uncharacterized protein LOC129629930 isoform X2 [Bubalus carabanensis]
MTKVRHFQVLGKKIPTGGTQNRDLIGRLNKAARPAGRDGEEIWVPLRHVYYREGPRDWTPPTGDAADMRGLVNDHRGAEKKTSTSEPLPDMGSGEKHDSSG